MSYSVYFSMRDAKHFLGTWVIASLLPPLFALDVYVHPNGNDQAAGTPGQPVQSLEEARDRLRVASDQADINTVWLGDGLYRMQQTLSLDERDSGPVTGRNRWCAAPGATPVLSGSIVVDNWQLHDAINNIWKAPVPVGLDTREIYVDGVRAIRARTESGLSGTVSIDEFGFLTSDPSPLNWSNVPGLEINMLSVWRDPRVLVESVSTTGAFTRITLQARPLQYLLDRLFNTPKDPQKVIQWIENDYLFIDREQEWFLDKPASHLYYKAADGTDPNDLLVTTPHLECLVQLEGHSVAHPVSRLTFHGLTLEESTFLRPSTDSYRVLRSHAFDESHEGSGNNNYLLGSAAIEGKFVTEVDIHRCVFRRHGSNGIVLRQGSQSLRIQGCTFTDMGGGAIQFGEPGEEDRNNVNPFDPRYLVRNIHVLDNYIHGVGELYRSANGIFAGFVVDCLIARNEVHETPYSSISLGWGWAWEVYHAGRGNIIEQNAVFRSFGDGLSDGGSIYTHNRNPDTVIRRNYLHKHRAYHALLYPDIGSAQILFEQNVMTQGARWLFMHMPLIEENTFRENYIDSNRSYLYGVNNVFENNRLYGHGIWPEPALEIIAESGPEAAYRDLVPLGITLVNPLPKAQMPVGETVSLVARPTGNPSLLSHVSFFSDGVTIGSDLDGSDGWRMDWIPHVPGDHALAARIHTAEASAHSETVTVQVLNSHQSRIYTQDTNGVICVEAEHYFRKTSPRSWTREWKTWTIWGGEQGTGAMAVFPNEGYASPADSEYPVGMDYALQFNRAGPHLLYGRARGNGELNDSFHAYFDGCLVGKNVGSLQVGVGAWQWVNQDLDAEAVVLDVTRPGLHALSINLAEDALFLDRLVVIPLSATPPRDEGPPESDSLPLGDVPALSLTVTSAIAYEVPAIPGEVTIWRERGEGPALSISIGISGTATSVLDVVTLPSTVALSATEGSVSIPVLPIDDGVRDPGETVSVHLNSSDDYLLLYPAEQRISIADPEESPASDWRKQYWGNWYEASAQDFEDPDNDGWVNLLEEALGSNPLAGILEEESLKPLKVWIEYEAGIPFLHLTHSRNIPAMETIDIRIEGSTSLAAPDWQVLAPLNKRMEGYDFANGRLLHYVFEIGEVPAKHFRLAIQRR